MTGEDPLLSGTGVALEVAGIELDGELFTGWRTRVTRVCELLGWPAGVSTGRPGTTNTLAFEAPLEHLAIAREVNEWALCAALAERDPGHWGCLRDALGQGARVVGKSGQPFPPPEIEEDAAFERFRQLLGTMASA